MILRLRCHLFFKAFFLVLKLLSFWYLRFQLHSCHFKLIVRDAKFDCIKALLEETLSADSFNIGNKSFFTSKEFVLSRLFTPVLPCEEFAFSHFISGLLASLLEGEEDALFESRLSNYLAENFMFLLHVLGTDGSYPFDKGLSLGSQGPSPADRHHEVLLGSAVLAEVTPPTEEVA